MKYCIYTNEMRSNRNCFFLLMVAALTGNVQPAFGHASEQGLVLLLPTQAYATAGTLVVVVSILLVTRLPTHILSSLFQKIDLGGRGGAKDFSLITSTLASVVFLTLIYIGFHGPTDPQNNLLPLTIWTVWWIGLFVVQGTVMDLWRWINPWAGLMNALDVGNAPILTLPKAWSAWPAVIVFTAFQIYLLADIAPNDPQRLATFALSYWIFTLIGLICFGQTAWLKQVECFTIVFTMIATLRPFQKGEKMEVGFPGWGTLKLPASDSSHAVLCLVILATGSFDGLHETFWWLAKIGINPLAFPGRSAVIWTSSLGVCAAIVVLVFTYSIAIWIGVIAVQMCGRSKCPTFWQAFRAFSVTLLPIALGYHFAHYLVTFMVQIKYVLSTLSDPLAQGWNLFGLGSVKVTTGFLNVPETVKMIWLTQAFVVVFSHVLAVLMSHRIAMDLCRDNKSVALVQIGLTILMIAYTVFGLWLLASPRGV